MAKFSSIEKPLISRIYELLSFSITAIYLIILQVMILLKFVQQLIIFICLIIDVTMIIHSKFNK